LEKEKDEQRQNEEFAKQGLRGMWEQVYLNNLATAPSLLGTSRCAYYQQCLFPAQVQQIFLYFCKRPDAASTSLPKDPVLPVSGMACRTLYIINISSLPTGTVATLFS